MRYMAVVEYDGTFFKGWQRQKGCDGKRSVQETIEGAIYSLSQQNVQVVAAGRTDAGVHAVGQVIHFDLRTNLQDHVIKGALNHYLREEQVSILSLGKVDDEFHARFSAKKRHYRYKISNRDAPLCIYRLRMWHIPQKLDTERMKEAASYMLGNKDFASFRGKYCQAKQSVKTLDAINIIQENTDINIDVSAQSFLHNQVRIITGTLVQCGRGLFSPIHIKEILEKKDRAAAGITAPPYGLYLMRVDY
ncbi:tRNA pseudouridine(38-40) synthase TruA [Anaplasma bovis]|uniref:tRNA pseudouridine(38-40) synthase TruA n=1 Tax=Anaplasma bovis TaxID=186733 RepID=UPI002FEE6C22